MTVNKFSIQFSPKLQSQTIFLSFFFNLMNCATLFKNHALSFILTKLYKL